MSEMLNAAGPAGKGRKRERLEDALRELREENARLAEEIARLRGTTEALLSGTHMYRIHFRTWMFRDPSVIAAYARMADMDPRHERVESGSPSETAYDFRSCVPPDLLVSSGRVEFRDPENGKTHTLHVERYCCDLAANRIRLLVTDLEYAMRTAPQDTGAWVF